MINKLVESFTNLNLLRLTSIFCPFLLTIFLPVWLTFITLFIDFFLFTLFVHFPFLLVLIDSCSSFFHFFFLFSLFFLPSTRPPSSRMQSTVTCGRVEWKIRCEFSLKLHDAILNFGYTHTRVQARTHAHTREHIFTRITTHRTIN